MGHSHVSLSIRRGTSNGGSIISLKFIVAFLLISAILVTSFFVFDTTVLNRASNLFQAFPTDEPEFDASRSNIMQGLGTNPEPETNSGQEVEDPPEMRKRDWVPIDNFILGTLRGQKRAKILERRRKMFNLDWSVVAQGDHGSLVDQRKNETSDEE